MLKLIPAEQPELQTARKNKKSIPQKKPVNQNRILQQQKNFVQETKNRNIYFKAVTIKLNKYIQNGLSATEPEMNDLIHTLQRTVLTLQKIRHKKHQPKPKKQK